MSQGYEKVVDSFRSIKDRIKIKPKVAVILGSGLGDYAEHIQVENIIEYSDIEGFPVSTVPGHKGQFVFGYVEKVPVVLMQGRVHYYEGYSMEDVVLPTRLMKMMGAEILILTNAAGGMGDGFLPGDLMMITDQISSFVPSPLTGPNIDEEGERFPDMSRIYDEDLQMLIKKIAKEKDIPLKKGVYLQMSGPNFESPAEIRMCKILGASAVGMSTACEAIAANHMGMKICGISCISNMAAGLSDEGLSHEDVQAMSDKIAPRFRQLITGMIQHMEGEFL